MNANAAASKTALASALISNGRTGFLDTRIKYRLDGRRSQPKALQIEYLNGAELAGCANLDQCEAGLCIMDALQILRCFGHDNLQGRAHMRFE